MFTRKTSIPDKSIFRIIDSSNEEGPTVAIILTFLLFLFLFCIYIHNYMIALELKDPLFYMRINHFQFLMLSQVFTHKGELKIFITLF